MGSCLGYLPRSFQLHDPCHSPNLVVCDGRHHSLLPDPESAKRLQFAWQLYHSSHSLITFTAVFALVWLVKGRPVFEMLGWLLHILLDIATHQGIFAIHFLWPFSGYSVSALRWENRSFFVANYAALVVVYLWLWIRHR